MAETASEQECICSYTDPSTWLSAASCGYGSGYEPGSMQEWDPDCPVHPATDYCEHDIPDYLTCGECAAASTSHHPRNDETTESEGSR